MAMKSTYGVRITALRLLTPYDVRLLVLLFDASAQGSLGSLRDTTGRF